MSFSDWKEIPLEESIEKLIDYRGKTPEKTVSGIPLITAKIVKDGKINTPQEFIEEDDYEAWMVRGFPKKGDVVLTTEAPLGEVASIDDENIALAQRIVVLRGKKGLLDNTYLKYHLMSHDIQHQLQSRASGSTVLGIKQSELRKIILKIPPMKVQQKIADNLDLLYQLSKQNETIFSNLDSIISALFRSWFIDFDPVRAKAEGKLPYGMDAETAELFPDSFETSKYGEIPTGWSYLFLEDLATLTKKSLNPKQKPDEKFFHYSIPAYDNGANPILTLGDDIESNKFVLPDNCVLLSKLNPKWNRVWIPELSSDYVGISSTEFLPWVPKNGVSVYYLYSLMVSQPFRWLMDSRISGTTGSHQRVRPDDCAKIPCLMPSVDVMKKFHDTVEKMNEQMKNLAKTHLDLVACRDALLPRLMSGELSVS